jgi:hypothetical protein
MIKVNVKINRKIFVSSCVMEIYPPTFFTCIPHNIADAIILTSKYEN